MGSCENLAGKSEELVFDVFSDSEPMERTQDGSDITGLRSVNDNTSNEFWVCWRRGWRFREFIVERITVVKFGVNDRGSNGTWRHLTNLGNAGYSKADECDSNRLWREMQFGHKR